jgi:hypothetical protein
MDGIVAGLLTVQVLGLAVLLFAGARRIRPRGEPEGGTAPVSMIVPVAGWSAATEAGLASLLAQDHPDFEIVLVTEDDADEAVPGIRTLLSVPPVAGCRRRIRVTAGPAESCAQKNRNLLAGVAASDSGRPLLVFCDAGHVAPADWLRRLTAPLAAGAATVATGYHHVRASAPTVTFAGRALTVLVLRLLQLVPGLTQPWGGAMAMPRSLFGTLDLAGFWAGQVVDDVSLSRRLRERGLRALPVPDAVVSSPLEKDGLSDWAAWLTRQLFFLKVYFPVAWLIGGLWGYSMALLLASAVWMAVMSGSVPSLAALGLFAILLGALRRFHPGPGPLLPWALAGWVAVAVACGCHARSGFARRIVWRGITYSVAGDGSVRVSRSLPRSSRTRVPS